MSTTSELPPELAARIAQFNAEPAAPIDEATQETLDALVSEMIELRQTIDELSDLKHAAEEKHDQIRKNRLPALMQQLGMVRPDGKGGFTHTSGAKIHLRLEVFAHYRKEHEEEVFAWMRENGHGDIIKEVIHPQTLKAFVRERVKEGEPVPPQITVTPETVAYMSLPKQTGETE